MSTDNWRQKQKQIKLRKGIADRTVLGYHNPKNDLTIVGMGEETLPARPAEPKRVTPYRRLEYAQYDVLVEILDELKKLNKKK